jgi:Rad3-related DNA helicase
VDTRYQAREQTAPQVAAAIEGMYGAHPGKYLVFFPSYAYLRRVAELLDGETLPLHVQTQSMLDSQRADFLRRFTGDGGPVLGLCVLGGVFAEGIDLPGLSLIGVCVVGVGLPMVNPRQEKLRGLYDDLFDNGFNLAYRYPGMHKVLQAAGRVIRSGEDRGVVLLLDERYRQGAYQQLLPPHYRVQYLGDAAQIAPMMQEFYHQGGIQP